MTTEGMPDAARSIARLTAERDGLRAALNLAEELICAIAEGAEQQSQSHSDVLAKIESYYAAVLDSLPPLTAEELAGCAQVAARVLARIRKEQAE